MDDDLESFLAEQKAKVAEERAILAQDPPYLEIRTKAHNAYSSAIKENIPPSKWSSVQRPHNNQEESAGLSLQLGEDYERKKQRLQQELRLDYRRYMAQALSKGLSDPLDIQPSPRPPHHQRAAPPNQRSAPPQEGRCHPDRGWAGGAQGAETSRGEEPPAGGGAGPMGEAQGYQGGVELGARLFGVRRGRGAGSPGQETTQRKPGAGSHGQARATLQS
ncbi:hypothetical protein SKAU_G00381550 [Synaphobranchus kaupii]|uniref:Centrosome and spindle pole associated protein 1 n=1 Tax=Synaphobranchus kaupii TaxID=118154 RepID=A0A9Q1EDR7_SYNKA|nr:hypothetical protein SKAU_G00381550 [Synaphobranchus kaupii]